MAETRIGNLVLITPTQHPSLQWYLDRRFPGSCETNDSIHGLKGPSFRQSIRQLAILYRLVLHHLLPNPSSSSPRKSVPWTITGESGIRSVFSFEIVMETRRSAAFFLLVSTDVACHGYLVLCQSILQKTRPGFGNIVSEASPTWYQYHHLHHHRYKQANESQS